MGKQSKLRGVRRTKLVASKTEGHWLSNFEPVIREIEEDSGFRRQMREVYDQGLAERGIGLLVLDVTSDWLKYITLDEFTQDTNDTPGKKTTLRFMHRCNPSTQIVVMATVDDEFGEGVSFYQSFLFNIPREVAA